MFSHSSLKITSLWQLTNGRSIAQMIFNGKKNLVDCEFIEDGGKYVRDFMDKFIDDAYYIRNEKLSSTKYAKNYQIKKDSISPIVDDEVLRIKLNAKFIPLKKLKKNIPEHLLKLLSMKKLKKQCNQLHRQNMRDIDVGEEENEQEQEEVGTGIQSNGGDMKR